MASAADWIRLSERATFGTERRDAGIPRPRRDTFTGSTDTARESPRINLDTRIGLIERMPVQTDHLRGVARGEGLASELILARRDELEMRRIHAVSNTTEMIHLAIRRYRIAPCHNQHVGVTWTFAQNRCAAGIRSPLRIVNH